jgi:hypothetical protein
VGENIFKCDHILKIMASAVQPRANQGTIDDLMGPKTPVSEAKLKEMDIVMTDEKYAGLPIFKSPSGVYLMKPVGNKEYVVIQAYEHNSSST